MTELEKIAYARSFIDKLANGINPIDGSIIPDGDTVNNVRLSRCFFFVSDVLRRVVENGGITPAPVVEEKKTPRKKKAPYYLLPEQAAEFVYSDIPIPSGEIFKRIIAIGPKEGVKKFPKVNLGRWLMSLGLLETFTLPLGSKLRRPTAAGEEMGISLIERQGAYGTYYTVVYNRDAQQFIIDNIDAIIAYGSAKDNAGTVN